MSAALFISGLLFAITGIALLVWQHVTEYPRRRKMTPQEREAEDSRIENGLW